MVTTYGLLSMVAEIGGYSGLLLGVSAFQIASMAAKAMDKKSS